MSISVGEEAERVADEATGIGADDAKSSVSQSHNPRLSQRLVLTTQGSAVAGTHRGLGIHVSSADTARPLSSRAFGSVDGAGDGVDTSSASPSGGNPAGEQSCMRDLRHGLAMIFPLYHLAVTIPSPPIRPARQSVVSGLSGSYSVDPFSSEARGVAPQQPDGDIPPTISPAQGNKAAPLWVSPPRHTLQPHIEPPLLSITTAPLRGKSPMKNQPQHTVADLKSALRDMAVLVGQQQSRIAELEAANASLQLQLSESQSGMRSKGSTGGGNNDSRGLPSPSSHARF
jgi:hypothetical protein